MTQLAGLVLIAQLLVLGWCGLRYLGLWSAGDPLSRWAWAYLIGAFFFGLLELAWFACARPVSHAVFSWTLCGFALLAIGVPRQRSTPPARRPSLLVVLGVGTLLALVFDRSTAGNTVLQSACLAMAIAAHRLWPGATWAITGAPEIARGPTDQNYHPISCQNQPRGST